jgi:hypothetical protein
MAIVNQVLFDEVRESLELPEDATEETVIRAHLAYDFKTRGSSGIGVSCDACGCDYSHLLENFPEYKFEMGPQYGPNYRTV